MCKALKSKQISDLNDSFHYFILSKKTIISLVYDTFLEMDVQSKGFSDNYQNDFVIYHYLKALL